MADRSWERGLHQLIEAKENVDVTDRRETQARITYQRFFRRYLRLAGMTGTAAEVAGEIWAVYGLKVARIPTHRPSQHKMLGQSLHATEAGKWQAVVARSRALREQGRAVLVGTRSVAASEALDAALSAAGLEHTVLNARQDAQEADIIAAAGQPGRIASATNMAGRGTDIDRAGRRGGRRPARDPHGVPRDAAHRSTALRSRGAHQGDPGSCEAIVSLEDELFRRFAPGSPRAAAMAPRVGGRVIGPFAQALQHQAQAAAERLNGRIRRATVRGDKQIDKSLAFAGIPE